MPKQGASCRQCDTHLWITTQIILNSLKLQIGMKRRSFSYEPSSWVAIESGVYWNVLRLRLACKGWESARVWRAGQCFRRQRQTGLPVQSATHKTTQACSLHHWVKAQSKVAGCAAEWTTELLPVPPPPLSPYTTVPLTCSKCDSLCLIQLFFTFSGFSYPEGLIAETSLSVHLSTCLSVYIRGCI